LGPNIGSERHQTDKQIRQNDPNFGGGDQQSNAMQTIDSDVGGPYIPADSIAPSMDSILDPNF
jgi:hypothetical protein